MFVHQLASLVSDPEKDEVRRRGPVGVCRFSLKMDCTLAKLSATQSRFHNVNNLRKTIKALALSCQTVQFNPVLATYIYRQH